MKNVKANYRKACDNLFIHTAVDTPLNVRQQAENEYNQAWHDLLDAGFLPDDAWNDLLIKVG
jgi:hypothetical protein